MASPNMLRLYTAAALRNLLDPRLKGGVGRLGASGAQPVQVASRACARAAVHPPLTRATGDRDGQYSIRINRQ